MNKIKPAREVVLEFIEDYVDCGRAAVRDARED